MALLFLIGAAFAVVAFGILAMLGAILKLAFWLLFLPLRLLFAVTAGAVGLLIGVVAAPLALLGIAVGVVIAGAVLIVPMLPLLAVALIVWAIYKSTSRRPSATA